MRSPIFVGILVVLAIAMIFFNVVWPLVKKPGRPKPGPAPAKQVQPAKKLLVNTPKQTGAPIRKLAAKFSSDETNATEVVWGSIDVPAVWSQSVRWVNAPKRDPFHDRRGDKGKSAQDMFTLKAIYHQTGSTLAVLNDRVISEGERIQEFDVVEIAGDRVWLQGPYGREDVRFKTAFAAAPLSPKNPEHKESTPDRPAVE
jgi:hypothetical protein